MLPSTSASRSTDPPSDYSCPLPQKIIPRGACGAKTKLQVGSIAHIADFGTVGRSGGMQAFPSAIFGVETKDIHTSASSQGALTQHLSEVMGDQDLGNSAVLSDIAVPHGNASSSLGQGRMPESQ